MPELPPDIVFERARAAEATARARFGFTVASRFRRERAKAMAVVAAVAVLLWNGHASGGFSRASLRDVQIMLAVVGVLSIFVYILPTIIARGVHHPHSGAIGFFNFFFGWTLLGWIVALVWAARPSAGYCPGCSGAVSFLAEACPSCGRPRNTHAKTERP